MSVTIESIPGTMLFTGAQARAGYHLNQFCMSLMSRDNRALFVADESAYLQKWPLTDAQRQAVLQRDYEAMMANGGNIFFILKIAATDGRSVQSVVASFTTLSTEDYAAMMLAGGRVPADLAPAQVSS